MERENPQKVHQSPGKSMSNPLPQRTGRRSPDPGTATSEEQSHTSRSHSELSSISLQLALIHLVSRVFPGMAFCGDTLPLGCQGDPSNGYTSAELAGTGLWNISETQRQRDKQTNLPSSAHLPYPQQPRREATEENSYKVWHGC